MTFFSASKGLITSIINPSMAVEYKKIVLAYFVVHKSPSADHIKMNKLWRTTLFSCTRTVLDRHIANLQCFRWTLAHFVLNTLHCSEIQNRFILKGAFVEYSLGFTIFIKYLVWIFLSRNDSWCKSVNSNEVNLLCFVLSTAGKNCQSIRNRRTVRVHRQIPNRFGPQVQRNPRTVSKRH